MLSYLFVYGTLKSNCLRNRFARGLAEENRWLGEARMQGCLYALRHYPCFRLPRFAGSGDGWVQGEVYRLHRPLATLANLDAYEGMDYRRLSRTAWLAGGKAVKCWVYCYRRTLAEHRRNAGGDWHSAAGAPPRYRLYPESHDLYSYRPLLDPSGPQSAE